ncbi:hypothetical protein Ciccas_010869, partial [Cichlidogyrus casuarinus]
SIEEILLDYGLTLRDDILAVTTDGCSMMQALGSYLQRELGVLHQNCIAHGCNLGATDSVSCDDAEADENEEQLLETVVDDRLQEVTPSWKYLLEKCRALIKRLRSGAINVAEYRSMGRLELLADVPTRWHSFV